MEFTRQPRIMPEYPAGVIEVEPPPNAAEKPEVSWFSILVAPVITVFISAFMMMGYGGGLMSRQFMLFGMAALAALAIVGSLINYNRQMSKYKKGKRDRERNYKQYIKDIDKELEFAAKQQASALRKLHPDPAGCISLMSNQSSNIWERTPSYEDFLTLRVGTGTVKASLRVSGVRDPGFMNTDPLAGEPKALALKYDKIADVPVCVDLKTAQICGIAGSNDKAVDMITNMLIQLVTHHGYDDVKIVVLAQEQAIRKWGWIRFLPHIWNDEFTSRFLLCGGDMAGSTLSEIYSILKEREKRSTNGDGWSGGEHYVFVVEDPAVLEGAQIRRFVYEPNLKIGVTAIFASEQISFLPSGCGTIVNLREKSADKTDRINNDKATFIPDPPVLAGADMAARRIAPLRIRAIVSNYALPKSVTLTQLLKTAGMNKTDDLSQLDVNKYWQKNKTYNGMSVPIGMGIGSMGSAVFNLDLHETGHGPHGLVAGTTGSGKSELLQSIIISLALNYHPHDVNFVLIDYKGGGMADVFKGMPHLAGVITNLSGRQTMRALLSIKGEILRRQTVFASYGVNNIDKYQRLYYRGETPGMPPISHLVLIADEFAELKQDQPDFMKELVSAARVGRSLGIHLILATQKPDGVVDDQIWSNSKFKICLKVQTEGDSNGVLKKPDAAYIKLPGRAYLQVGNDEIYEMFQSAYSGADYLPERNMPKQNKNRNISILSLDGKPTLVYPQAGGEKPEEDRKNPTQLEAVVKHITAVSAVAPLEGPWTPPLEEKIYLNELDVAKKPKTSIVSAMVGLVDDPRNQCKFPLEIDFFNDGNLLVYGMPGTGKTFLLRTICLSLALRYSPDEVNIYILDMNGTGFKMFNKLPHCGGVLNIDEASSIRQFSRFLVNTIEARKKMFEAVNAENFGDYRANNTLPAMVVMVDNYLGLSETYDDVNEQIQGLIREGFKYGIYFVATASSDYGIQYKMSINFKMVVAFQLVDATSYSALVGRTDGTEPEDFPGRGLARFSKPLEIQALLPETRQELKENEFKIKSTKEVIRDIALSETGKAVPIPIMPDKISVIKLNEGNTGDGLFIGLRDSDLTPVYIDFSDYTSFMITGNSGCGKSTLVSAWLKLYKNTKIYLMDSSSLGLLEIASREDVTDLTRGDLREFVYEFEDVIDERRAALNDIRRTGGDVKALLKSWEQIVFVFDKFSEFSEEFDYGVLKDLIIRIVNKERGLKIIVLALDTLDGFDTDYENVTKQLKRQSTGILLGSLKEQTLFDCRFPYGTVEKELLFGDGYLINKTRSLGLRVAF